MIEYPFARGTTARIVARTALAAALALPAAAAATLPQRTFVASTGSDANPCSITQPCRGFAAAMAAVNPGGEIIVLDSGGYGPVTINKSVAIIATPGVYAGITVASGDGITVATAGIDVRLKGLTINGLGGMNGVRVTAGNSIRIEDCTIANLQWGVRVDGPVLVDVRTTRFDRNSGAGVWVQDGTVAAVSDSEFVASLQGVYATISKAPNTTRVSVARSSFVKVGTGLRAVGMTATGKVFATISDSTFTGDLTPASSYLVLADCQPGGSCVVDVTATRNIVIGAYFGGLYANAAGATIIATQNTISDSGIGLAGITGGVVWTLQDNTVNKNVLDTNGTITDKTYR